MISKEFLVTLIVMSASFNAVLSQRSPYAGSRPVGYKDRFRPKDNDTTATDNDIVNRFGGPGADGTQKPPMQNVEVVYGEQGPNPQNNQGASTVFRPSTTNPILQTQTPSRLPFDAHGDVDLVNRVSNFPIDQQPFWLINYQLIEAQRNSTRNNVIGTSSSRSSFLGK